jgi:hypothetical protein
MTDQFGQGSYSLIQSFTVAPGTTDVTVSFDLFANDQAGVIVDNGHDWKTAANENAEADILTGGADPFTNSPGDIVEVLYGPGADNLSNNPNPWTSYSDNLGALTPGTYQVRFAETDTGGFFQMGVDNVVVDATSAVPEPATWAMMMVGLFGVGGLLRHRRQQGPVLRLSLA